MANVLSNRYDEKEKRSYSLQQNANIKNAISDWQCLTFSIKNWWKLKSSIIIKIAQWRRSTQNGFFGSTEMRYLSFQPSPLPIRFVQYLQGMWIRKSVCQHHCISPTRPDISMLFNYQIKNSVLAWKILSLENSSTHKTRERKTQPKNTIRNQLNGTNTYWKNLTEKTMLKLLSKTGYWIKTFLRKSDFHLNFERRNPVLRFTIVLENSLPVTCRLRPKTPRLFAFITLSLPRSY